MMSAIHPRPVSEKIVSDLPQLVHIFDVLKKIVGKHHLSGEITRPVIPTEKVTKNQLIERAKNKGWFVPGFIDKLSASHFHVFEAFTPAFDSSNIELYEKYDENWAIQLLENTDKSAAEIESLSTDSVKLTIAEIYNRLVIQALRGDNLHELPKDKDRFVWLDILTEFHELLIEGKSADCEAVKLEVPFRNMLTNIKMYWSGTLRDAVQRLTDTEKGVRVCSAAGQVLRRMRAYINMVLLCELVEKAEENKEWKGRLTIRMASVTLAEIEKALIKKATGKTEYSIISYKTPIVDLEKSTDPMKGNVAIENLDLVSLGWLKPEEAANQLIICDLKKDNYRVRALYALKNRIVVMEKLVMGVGSMMGPLTWMPKVLEKMPFHQLDNLMDSLHLTFCALIDKTEYIDTKLRIGSKLHDAMLSPLGKASDLKFEKIGRFGTLKSPEWLDKVSAHCMTAINHVIVLGKINKCEVFPVALKSLMKEDLPATHDVRLRIEEEEKEEKYAERSAIASSGISSYLAQSSFVDQELKMRKLARGSVAVAPMIRQTFSLKMPCIIRFLKLRGIYEKVDSLYNAFRNMEHIDFIEVFANARQNFTDENQLMPHVRALVQVHEGKEYIFRLKSKRAGVQCAADVIYIESATEGLQYEVLGPDKQKKEGMIKWDKLPAHFPKAESAILQSGDICFPTILAITTEKGHTEKRAMRSQVFVATTKEAEEEWHNETELLFMLKLLSVEAAIMGYEAHLLEFLEVLMHVPQHKPLKRYEILLQKIFEQMELLTSKRDYEPYFTPKGLPETMMSVNRELKAEVKALEENKGVLVEVTESQGMQLAERREEIKELKEVLSEREREVKERDKTIEKMKEIDSEHEATIARKDKVIAEQEKALSAKEMSDQEKRDELMVEKRRVEEISAVVKAKDAMIGSIIEKSKDKIEQVKRQAQKEKEHYEEQIVRLSVAHAKVLTESDQLQVDHQKVLTENAQLKKEIAELKERLKRESKSGYPAKSGLYSKSSPSTSSPKGGSSDDKKDRDFDSDDNDSFFEISLK